MIAWNDRKPKLHAPSKHNPSTIPEHRSKYPKQAGFDDQFDEWYGFLINDWIPSQPDAEELMSLFISCKFFPYPFICILRWPDTWQEKVEKWIAKREETWGGSK